MRLPKFFTIKGKRWNIKRGSNLCLPDGQPCMGLCDPNERTIWIDETLSTRETLVTFLHELNHAIKFELHIVSIPIDIEEVLVDGFADVYADLFDIRFK